MKLTQLSLAAAMLTAVMAGATAQVSNDAVKIGVITDLSGLYSDLSGQGSIAAARMAIEDFGKTVLGKPIELLTADSHNKADVAASRAREWIDQQHVDVLMDLVPTNAALAVMDIAAQKNKLAIVVGSASSVISNEKCTATSVHWMYDTYSSSVGTGKALLKRGGDSWYFLTADYAFGKSLEKDVSDVVTAAGGKVLGAARHPLNSNDFSSFLMQAQASKAKVIGLANAGGDAVNAVKQAGEFGIATKGVVVAPLLMFISDVHAIGLKYAQDMYLTEGFYWDYNDGTRAWSRRFFAIQKKMPTMAQAGMYSAVTHYLKAVKAAGTDDTAAVMTKMRELPVNDVIIPKGTLRADGRMVHDMLLLQVKKPAESKSPWDYYRVVDVIPANEAFRPLAQSGCALVKK
ncbi:branched-chain amino acid transport system substrate-binding protein [Duganella sp. 1411]|jgi:branched-chain amino acid transport system substrate-binding protein|uniref:ABC transporter substrate-binding protein n=1 Tax=Duganella sp. 1411 TaxID=2806572 RepID=UPI001AE2B77B|nr:ABC transporter substrate-binding protein [Duganella sp. 1411]MBP1202093.1 branched-chain amino acid transport system substrate-binding protein [Duganella sp. 1411]